MPWFRAPGLLIVSLAATIAASGAAAQSTGTYYERTAFGTCEGGSTNRCRAVFPITPSNRFLTVHFISCYVVSSNGRPVNVARVGTTDSPTGPINRVRHLNITVADGQEAYVLSTAAGNPYLKIAPGRYVAAELLMGGDFPYNGSISCTLAGDLTNS